MWLAEASWLQDVIGWSIVTAGCVVTGCNSMMVGCDAYSPGWDMIFLTCCGVLHSVKADCATGHVVYIETATSGKRAGEVLRVNDIHMCHGLHLASKLIQTVCGLFWTETDWYIRNEKEGRDVMEQHIKNACIHWWRGLMMHSWRICVQRTKAELILV